MATNFPNQVDTFSTMLDITADDAALVKQYQDAMEAGSYDVAQQALAQIPNNQQKIISAGLMNDVLDGLTATEQYFGDRYSLLILYLRRNQHFSTLRTSGFM